MAQVALSVGRLDIAEGDVMRLAALLAPEERAQADRFRFERDRRRFIVRRARRRERLAAHLGAAPAALRFVEGPFGQPRLADCDIAFSTSHSGEIWAVAIGTVALGVDIEAIDRTIDHAGIASSLFAPGEVAALARLGREDAATAFYACWSRKEAFVKAIGRGLSYPLDAFEVSLDACPRLLRGGAGWRLTAPDLGPTLACALVTAEDGMPLTLTVDRQSDDAAVSACRGEYAVSAAIETVH